VGEVWRVVLRDGSVREVMVTTEHSEGCPPEYTCEGECSIRSAHDAVMLWVDQQLWTYRKGCDVREILAPGEPTRAEMAAQLAAVIRERDEMAARRDDALADYAAVNEYLGGIVRAWQRASDDDRRMADAFVSRLRREIEEARDSGRGEWWEACRGGNPAPLRTELAVLRAQQAPLVACVDALRAAATAAGWRDADATGETLVAWVRRGALLDAARIALERGGERVAKAIVARANEEGGE